MLDKSSVTNFGGSSDPGFLDDITIKYGSLGEYAQRIYSESPEEWVDWPSGGGVKTMTLEGQGWRAHYVSPHPLAFYHEGRFILGVGREPSDVRMDFYSRDQAWYRLVSNTQEDYTVVLERDDFPRFKTEGAVGLSFTPEATERENVFRLGNGYSIACTKEAQILEEGMLTGGEAWWMLGPTEKEESLSRRVLAIKIYDGPFPYEARGTDIRLSDPAPLASEAEYVVYAYDSSGLKSLYRKNFSGTKVEKRAMTISGKDLLNFNEREGELFEKENQLAGRGVARYSFPLKATKLLNVYHRGSEVELKIRTDDGDWLNPESYDGRAVNNLEIESSIYNSLSAIRIEWEAIKDWEPVGRPYIDVLPVETPTELQDRNKIKITGKEGEGLGQVIGLPTGTYTASASVRCLKGEALIGIGGHEIIRWQTLDKEIRGPGLFSVNSGKYEMVLTGRGDFSFEIDRIRVAPDNQSSWLPEDIRWFVETEGGEILASESVNNLNSPVSTEETKRWRLGIANPKEAEREVQLSGVYADLHRTGEEHFTRTIKWRGSGNGRICLPENIIDRPLLADHIEVKKNGAITIAQESKKSVGDVRATIDNGEIYYQDQFIYRPITLENEFWRIEVGEESAIVFYQNTEVGRMEGKGLPFRLFHRSTEDVQLDCSIGLVQLRRGLGPRFEGWNLLRASMPVSTSGAVKAFGFNEQEAQNNLNFYVVY